MLQKSSLKGFFVYFGEVISDGIQKSFLRGFFVYFGKVVSDGMLHSAKIVSKGILCVFWQGRFRWDIVFSKNLKGFCVFWEGPLWWDGVFSKNRF